MKQKFLNFVLNNPTSLATVSEQWYVRSGDEWVPSTPDIPADATADEVDAIVKAHEQKMEALGDDATKKRDGLKIGLHTTAREGQEHVIRVKRAGKEIKSYWDQLVMMFNPETKLYKEMGGFISIGSIFPNEWNWYSFWNVSALLSIILAVMNLLPIPVLDGGHVIFALWEMITRRKPNEKLLTVLQNIGFYLLMALLIYANGSDIIRLFQ
jgi:membrane-associated protease RseP (regulator of RpoE activity)